MEAPEPVDGKKASTSRAKGHKKRVASYAYSSLTKADAASHLRAYLVTIDAGVEHQGVEYRHEGEEFIYVLKGGLVIQVGANTTILSKGDSIHFNSGLHHKLSNPTAEATKLLVTIYTP
jgi:quercetin dioxygenase-like cupin family protein